MVEGQDQGESSGWMLREIGRDVKYLREQWTLFNGRLRANETDTAVLSQRLDDCQTRHFVQAQINPGNPHAPKVRVLDKVRANSGPIGLAVAGLVLALQIIMLLLKALGF